MEKKFSEEKPLIDANAGWAANLIHNKAHREDMKFDSFPGARASRPLRPNAGGTPALPGSIVWLTLRSASR
jgi:hypothetical protein